MASGYRLSTRKLGGMILLTLTACASEAHFSSARTPKAKRDEASATVVFASPPAPAAPLPAQEPAAVVEAPAPAAVVTPVAAPAPVVTPDPIVSSLGAEPGKLQLSIDESKEVLLKLTTKGETVGIPSEKIAVADVVVEIEKAQILTQPDATKFSFKGLASGDTVIHFSLKRDAGVKVDVPVTVTANTANVTLTGSVGTLKIIEDCANFALKAVLVDNDGNETDVTNEATWASDHDKLLSVAAGAMVEQPKNIPDGKFTPVVVKITADYAGIGATYDAKLVYPIAMSKQVAFVNTVGSNPVLPFGTVPGVSQIKGKIVWIGAGSSSPKAKILTWPILSSDYTVKSATIDSVQEKSEHVCRTEDSFTTKLSYLGHSYPVEYRNQKMAFDTTVGKIEMTVTVDQAPPNVVVPDFSLVPFCEGGQGVFAGDCGKK